MDHSASRPNISQKSKKPIFAVIGVASLFVISIIISVLISWAIFQQIRLENPTQVIADGNTKLTEEEIDTAKVAEKVSASVVSIITSGNGGYNDTTQMSAGTGIIISADGYILTNKHVVENARRFEIVTNSGDKYSDVLLVGVDPLNDSRF